MIRAAFRVPFAISTGAAYVGWSMGGAVAQVMDAMVPARLRCLVLFATTPQLAADENFGHALPPEAVGELAGLFEVDFPQGCAGFAEVCAPGDPETGKFLTNVMTGTDPKIGLASLASGGAQNQLKMLDKITVETHVIHGQEDAVCLPAAAEYLASHVTGCRWPVRWIKDAGHGAHLTHADLFNAHLRDCLD